MLASDGVPEAIAAFARLGFAVTGEAPAGAVATSIAAKVVDPAAERPGE
jgi:hypothetical protein